MNRRRRSFIKYVLILIDAVTILLSYLLTYILRDHFLFLGLEKLADFSRYFPYMVFILVLWLVLLSLFNNFAYLGALRSVSLRRIYLNILPVEIVGLSIVAMVLFFLRDSTISRTFLVIFAVINYISLALVKQLFFIYFFSLKENKKYHRKALLLGHGRTVEQFRASSEKHPELLFDIAVEPDFITRYGEQKKPEEISILFRKVIDYIQANVVDEVVLAYADIDLASIAPFVNECASMGIMVNIILDLSEIDYKKTEIETFDTFNIISLQTYDFSPSQRFFKRLLDFFFGLIGLLLFSLLFLFVAPAIKLSSPGPVFFKQKRMGKNGRTFSLYKFRTMYADAEARKKELEKSNEMKGLMFKIKDDPRITTVGRFLRKTSIDEFPQFINVLKGDMSLVGTRPPTVEEWEQYESHHRRRLSVQSGITGIWQVSGRNKISDFEEIVKLDTWYIDNWSIWLDLKIILKTVLVLFSGQ